jgi:hypothetical protein
MMKEKQIRFWLPFVLVFGGSYFLSDADLFHSFGARFEVVQYNFKLILLFLISDIGGLLVFICSSLIFFKAWKLNRSKNTWYSDLFWQLGSVYLCWAVLFAISLLANVRSFLWIYGMIKLAVFIVSFYVLNTLFRVRKLIYYPETREETILKAKKYDDLMALLEKHKKDGITGNNVD